MATPPNQMGLTGPVQANDIVMRASEIGTTIPGIASLAMKSARKGAQRGVQGIYQLPSGNEPTPEFMNVSQQNLNNQTRQMTNMLNMMAPEDEQLAYINEQEAGILKLLGGSGEMTPQGIPTYRGMGGYGGGDEGPGSSGSSGSSGTGGMGGEGQGGSQTGESSGNKGDTSTDSGPATSDPGAESGPGGMGGMGADDSGSDDSGGSQTGESSGNKGDVSTDSPDPGPGPGPGEEGGDYRESVEEAAETEVDRETMKEIAKRANTVVDRYGNPVTNTNPETGVTTNVFSKKGYQDAMQDYDDRKTREAFMQEAIDDAKAYAKSGLSRDAAYGLSGLSEFGNEGMGLQGATAAEGLGNMGDRLGELAAKARANTITTTELNELAQLNEFYGKNPTTSMGLVESLKYQFTNPDFKADLAKAAPVLGALALTTLAPASLKSIMSLTQMMTSFSKKPSKSLRDTIESALAKLGVKERSALASNLPSTYRGFGVQGRGEGAGGGADQREEARRDTGEEEDTRERDRFERAFANRYFIGPASLDEVRKYAVTGGGYNQLTPFYGREKETV